MKRVFGQFALSLLLLVGCKALWCQSGSTNQAEDLKAQNAKALKMNALITQANTAMTAKNWQDAIAPFTELASMAPDNWQFLSGLGDAQLKTGKYQDAVQTYSKGIQLAQNVVSGATPPDPHKPWTDPAQAKAGLGKMLTGEGNAYLKLRKNTDAIAAYNKAAEIDPNPAVAYFNLCATQYNTGETDGALSACDKAIQYDPTKADAYFIKGSILFSLGKVEAHGKYILPAGTVETLQKYLKLSPNGPHASDVKAMLDAAGANP